MFKSLFQYIEENLERKIDIEDAAKAAGYSASHLHRLFTFAYGISVADYIRKRKLTNSLPLLLDRRKSILDIAMGCFMRYFPGVMPNSSLNAREKDCSYS